jgi:hypothetical protein
MLATLFTVSILYPHQVAEVAEKAADKTTGQVEEVVGGAVGQNQDNPHQVAQVAEKAADKTAGQVEEDQDDYLPWPAVS